jgi:hypothetical protein
MASGARTGQNRSQDQSSSLPVLVLLPFLLAVLIVFVGFGIVLGGRFRQRGRGPCGPARPCRVAASSATAALPFLRAIFQQTFGEGSN